MLDFRVIRGSRWWNRKVLRENALYVSHVVIVFGGVDGGTPNVRLEASPGPLLSVPVAA